MTLLGKTDNPSVSTKNPIIPVCSLCVFPATVECCKPQTRREYRTLELGEKEDTERQDSNSLRQGCGLKLCSMCRRLVYGQCGGRLDESVIEEVTKKRKTSLSFDPARADRSFLYERSLIERRHHAVNN